MAGEETERREHSELDRGESLDSQNQSLKDLVEAVFPGATTEIIVRLKNGDMRRDRGAVSDLGQRLAGKHGVRVTVWPESSHYSSFNPGSPESSDIS